MVWGKPFYSPTVYSVPTRVPIVRTRSFHSCADLIVVGFDLKPMRRLKLDRSDKIRLVTQSATWYTCSLKIASQQSFTRCYLAQSSRFTSYYSRKAYGTSKSSNNQRLEQHQTLMSFLTLCLVPIPILFLALDATVRCLSTSAALLHFRIR